LYCSRSPRTRICLKECGGLRIRHGGQGRPRAEQHHSGEPQPCQPSQRIFRNACSPRPRTSRDAASRVHCLPAAVLRFAAEAADRDERAHEQIDQPARDAGRRAVTAWHAHPERNSRLRLDDRRCRERIHVIDYLMVVLPYRLHCALTIALINQAASLFAATLPPPSPSSSAACLL